MCERKIILHGKDVWEIRKSTGGGKMHATTRHNNARTQTASGQQPRNATKAGIAHLPYWSCPSTGEYASTGREMEAEAEVEEGAGAEAEAMTLGELWTECDAVGCVGTLGGMLCLTI